jgi:hypothetical protein
MVRFVGSAFRGPSLFAMVFAHDADIRGNPIFLLVSIVLGINQCFDHSFCPLEKSVR